MFTAPLRSLRASRRTLTVLLPTLLLAALPSSAATIVNGSFENVGAAVNSFAIDLPTALPGWSATPSGNKILDCLVMPGDTNNLCGGAFGGGFQFWNAGTGGNFPGGPSPDGGNFIAMDGDNNYSSALTQLVTGLTIGQQYNINFYQGAAQQYGFTGPTTEQWQVSLGAQTQLSTLQTDASHGYVDWSAQSLTFTATATSETLSFLAKGTPSGVPPFSLLDGVSITPSGASSTPEPSSLVLIGIGVGAAALFARRKARLQGEREGK